MTDVRGNNQWKQRLAGIAKVFAFMMIAATCAWFAAPSVMALRGPLETETVRATTLGENEATGVTEAVSFAPERPANSRADGIVSVTSEAGLLGFAEECDAAFQDAQDEINGFFDDRKANGLQNFVDEMTGLVGKYRGVTQSEDDFRNHTQDAWDRCLYSRPDLQAKLALVSENLSAKLRKAAQRAVERASDRAKRECPLFASESLFDALVASEGSESIHELSIDFCEDLRSHVIDDLNVNLLADVACTVVTQAVSSTVAGMLLGTAIGGPIGTVVGGLVGFAIGVAVAVLIEMSPLGTVHEKAISRRAEQRIELDRANTLETLSRVYDELIDQYAAWLGVSLKKAVRSRLPVVQSTGDPVVERRLIVHPVSVPVSK